MWVNGENYVDPQTTSWEGIDKHKLMTNWSHGNIFRVTGPLCGGIQRSPRNSPHKVQWRGALIFFHLYLNKQLSKQSRHWWFEYPTCSLWRNCNVMGMLYFRSSNCSDKYVCRCHIVFGGPEEVVQEKISLNLPKQALTKWAHIDRRYFHVHFIDKIPLLIWN